MKIKNVDDLSLKANGKKMIAWTLLGSIILSSCGKGGGGAPEPMPPIAKPETELNTPGPQTTTQPGDFSIAVLPDTQYYIGQPQLGGTLAMFKAQIDWIQNNQAKENIAYVAHLGDITEHGDNPSYASTEWSNAKTMIYGLENPNSIPYGLAVGNHDQFPSQYPLTGTTTKYNQYFGVKHYEGRSYYGGHYSNNNDSHYDLFTAGGVDFIVIYVEYDVLNEDQANMNAWVYELLGTFASRKAIVVSHSIMSLNPTVGSNTPQGNFSGQGKAMYERFKTRPNLFMMICGHVGDNGEGYRTDVFEGHTVKTFLSDYQSRANGGNGLMRLYKFSVANNTLSVKTFSPFDGTTETDGDSQFTVPLFN
jgi:predicted phosphodiesterase